MYTRESILEEIKSIVSTFALVDDNNENNIVIDESDILFGEGFGIDSTSLISIVVEIERKFNIEIEDEYLTMDFLSTIGSIANYVEELIKDNESI